MWNIASALVPGGPVWNLALVLVPRGPVGNLVCGGSQPGGPVWDLVASYCNRDVRCGISRR